MRFLLKTIGKMEEENIYKNEIEEHVGALLKICKDHGAEIGELVAIRDGEKAGIIAQKNAEKSMLLSIIRYMLDSI